MDLDEVVWYSVGNESLNETHLSENWKRGIRTHLRNFAIKESREIRVYVWWEAGGGGVDRVAEGRSGAKRDLFLLIFFFLNKWNYSMCADNTVGGKMVIQKKENN